MAHSSCYQEESAWQSIVLLKSFEDSQTHLLVSCLFDHRSGINCHILHKVFTVPTCSSTSNLETVTKPAAVVTPGLAILAQLSKGDQSSWFKLDTFLLLQQCDSLYCDCSCQTPSRFYTVKRQLHTYLLTLFQNKLQAAACHSAGLPNCTQTHLLLHLAGYVLQEH